jgi:DNA polymerase-1
VKHVIVDNAFKVRAFREQATRGDIGALDIETTVEENPWLNTPQLVSVAVTFDGYGAWVFRDDEYLPQAHLDQYRWIMHNGLFDRLMMRMFGYDCPLYGDTMAMQYLLDPDEPKSLEDLSLKYLGLPAYKDVDYHNILNEPFEKVAEMNGEDVLRTYNLYRPLADLVNKNKALSRVYQWIIMPAIEELIRVTENGIPLDLDRFQPVWDWYEAEVETARTDLEDFTAPPRDDKYPKGWPRPSSWRVNDKIDPDSGEILVKGQGKWDGTKFNPGSPNQVRHILFDQWDLPILEWTKPQHGKEEGFIPQPSTNADVLLQLETYHTKDEQQEWLTKLRNFRKKYKVLTSYLRSWPELVDEKHWLHPRYKPLHVVTGRLSSDQPNIQNVPRTKEFRDLFGGVEGMTWIKADYSQIELRIAAWLSNETLMLQAYEDGEDLHRLTARLVLGDDSDEARQVGKTLNFGLLYGAGPRTLQRIARTEYEVFLTEGEAKVYHGDFFRAYPGLQQWHKKMERSVCSTGISKSPLGRIRYLPNAKIPWEIEDMRGHKIGAIHEGLNHPVQSFASDLLLTSLIRLRPQLTPLGAFVVAEVHDEIDALCPTEGISAALPLIKATMEDVSWLSRHGIKLGVPVVADIETGTHWGSVS